MTPGLFIAGTDTAVGKTWVACACAAFLRGLEIDIGVLKPAESGSSWDDPERDARRLRRAAQTKDALELINPYHFTEALAPGVAAQALGLTIEFQNIQNIYQQLAARHSAMLVEGAGGLMVPLGPEGLVIDLIARLGLPVLLVGRLGLGTINHSLLSLEALERRRLPCLGLVLNASVSESDLSALSNAQTLERLSSAPFLGVLPYQAQTETKILPTALQTVLLRHFSKTL